MNEVHYGLSETVYRDGLTYKPLEYDGEVFIDEDEYKRLPDGDFYDDEQNSGWALLWFDNLDALKDHFVGYSAAEKLKVDISSSVPEDIKINILTFLSENNGKEKSSEA